MDMGQCRPVRERVNVTDVCDATDPEGTLVPYYIHPMIERDEPQEHARVAMLDKRDAIAALGKGEAMTYVATQAEITAWRKREYVKLHGDVSAAPTYRALPFNTPWDHYAHRAEADPAKVSYTPDDQYGHEGRRLVTTPVRYMEKYADLLTYSRDQFAALAGKMRAPTDLRLAITAEEIARVYVAKEGPESCMDGRNFNSAACPARMYAGGDLACAYLGALGSTPGDDALVARARVWAERKTYVRAYGDEEAIIAILEADGYRRVRHFVGARLRAELTQNGRAWRVPYIDGTVQSLDEQGEYLVISEDGLVSGLSQLGYTACACGKECRHCNDHFTNDDSDGAGDQLCQSCYEAVFTCESCDAETFGESYIIRDAAWCDHCYTEQRNTCDHCGGRYDNAEREDGSPADCCASCADDYTMCDRCETDGHADDLQMAEHGARGALWCLDCRRQSSRLRRRARPAIIIRYPTLPMLHALLDWVRR